MEISCPSLPCARRLWQRPLAWGFSAWESHSSPCHGGLAGSPYLIDVQGHKLSGTIVAVGTIFMKLTLLGSYSFERQSAAAEPFSSPAPWSPMGRLLGLQLSGYVLEHVLGSRCWFGHSPVCHWAKGKHHAGHLTMPLVQLISKLGLQITPNAQSSADDMNSNRKNNTWHEVRSQST